ncbi:MAG TPA: hypothetical protein VGJ15_00560 [Pirellulales bacterium]
MIENLSPATDANSVVEVVLRTVAHHQERRKMARIKRAIRRQTSGGVQELAVEMQGDSLLLRGRCLSFYCKQVAQETAMSEFSGRQLINQIEVAGLPR